MTSATQPAASPIRRTVIDGIYEVASKSYPGHFYTVDVRHHSAPTCDCMAGQNNFENCRHVAYCWHVRAAMELDMPLWIARTQRTTERVCRETEALLAEGADDQHAA